MLGWSQCPDIRRQPEQSRNRVFVLKDIVRGGCCSVKRHVGIPGEEVDLWRQSTIIVSGADLFEGGDMMR